MNIRHKMANVRKKLTSITHQVVYRSSINIGRVRLRKTLQNTAVIDPNRTLEQILEPTIFISNHIYTGDIPHLHLALQREFGKYQPEYKIVRTVSKDDNFMRTLEEISKSDNGPSKELYYKLKNDFMNYLIGLVGTIFIKAKDSQNPKPRQLLLRPAVSALNSGSHILVFNMGGTSIDGRIDYVRNPTIDTFDQNDGKAISSISRLAKNSYIQTIHHTIDPVYGSIIVTMGPRHHSKERYNFVDEIKECTTITGLQLYSVYKNVLMGLELRRGDTMGDLLDLSKLLVSKKVTLHVPENKDVEELFKDVIDYVKSRKTHELEIYGKKRDIASQKYQANQVKHLGIDGLVKEYLGIPSN